MRRKAKILLVDDDIDFIAATEAVLRSVPYDVVTANTGDEGLLKARKETPDLIILDVIMPVRDGFSAAELIKKDPGLAGIPILMLTAYSSTGQGSGVPRSGGLTLAAEDYLEKPVDPQQLLATVKQLLAR